MEGFDPRNATEPVADRRTRPNEGELFFEEKLLTDPCATDARRMLSRNGGQASPRNEHY
jgi:hypothetical protein